jgi:hypothetical protein
MNWFEFKTPLTNVVKPDSSLGSYNVCSTTILDVVKLNREPKRCLLFQIGTHKEIKLAIGKTFISVTPPELILALYTKRFKNPKSE